MRLAPHLRKSLPGARCRCMLLPATAADRPGPLPLPTNSPLQPAPQWSSPDGALGGAVDDALDYVVAAAAEGVEETAPRLPAELVRFETNPLGEGELYDEMPQAGRILRMSRFIDDCPMFVNEPQQQASAEDGGGSAGGATGPSVEGEGWEADKADHDASTAEAPQQLRQNALFV